MKMLRKQNGITLIALVVTVIVLVILAGVAISALTNNKSIIDGANATKIEYKKQSMLEAIKTAETQLRLDNQINGTEINIETLKNKLEKIFGIEIPIEDGTATIIDKETGIVIDITMDANGKTTIEVNIVDDISKVTKPTIVHELIPQDNGEVVIKITVTEKENGIAKIQFPDNREETYSNQKEVVEEYTVTENGTYKFTAQSANGRTASKSIEVTNTLTAADIDIQVLTTEPTQGPTQVKIVYDENAKIGGVTLTNEDRYRYKIGDGNWETSSSAEITVPVNSNKTVYAQYYTGTQGYKTTTATVNNIDTASPEAFDLSTTVTTNSIQISGTTEDVGIEGTAAGNIGISGYSFKLSDSEGNVIVDWTPEQAGGSYTFSTNETLTITHNTTYKVSMKAIDLAGNEREATNANESVTTTAVVDSEANIGISYSPTIATQGPVNVTFTNDSGDDSLTLKYKKQDETDWTPYTAPIPMATNGYIDARLFDTQGQYTNTATAQVTKIDLDAPQTPTLTSSSVTDTTFTLTATAQDSPSTTTSTSSGIASYEFYINGSKYATNTTGVCSVTERTASTTYTCKVIVYDGVGRSTPSADVTVTTEKGVWTGGIAEDFAGGTGTSDDPYRIETAEQLAYLASSVNKGISYSGQYISLENDLDLGGVQDDEGNWSGQEWTTIGDCTFEGYVAFRGYFNGNGHKIKNLYIDNAESYRQGLFGDFSGTLENLTIESGFIRGYNCVGAFVGYVVGSVVVVISNVVNYATVMGNSSIGGIVGYHDYNSDFSLNMAYNYGDVSATKIAAGIVGSANYFDYENVENYGVISGETTDDIYNFYLCFVAGTKVMTEDGLKNIEDIKVGEKVLSYNEGSSQYEFKPVIKTSKNTADVLVELNVGNETIKCTPPHRFYVENKGWIAAKDLKVGDKLISKDSGIDSYIEKIEYIEDKENLVNVYNLTVEGNHNYLVTKYQLLVHNAY